MGIAGMAGVPGSGGVATAGTRIGVVIAIVTPSGIGGMGIVGMGGGPGVGGITIAATSKGVTMLIVTPSGMGGIGMTGIGGGPGMGGIGIAGMSSGMAMPHDTSHLQRGADLRRAWGRRDERHTYAYRGARRCTHEAGERCYDGGLERFEIHGGGHLLASCAT